MSSDGVIKRPTIHDVSKRAGVTPSTVSRILNKRQMAFPVAEETRRRVLEAVRDLGYRPNRLARSLALSKTQVIGMYFPITEPTGQLEHNEATWLAFGSLISGVQHVTQQEGYEVHIFNRVEHDYGHPNPPREICPDFIDGLIYVEPNSRYDFYSDLVAAGVPMVSMGPSPLDPPGFSVCPDNRYELYRLTKALVAKGHRRIGFLTVTPNESPLDCLQRMEGYRDALGEAGIPFDPRLMPRERVTPGKTGELICRLLDEQPRPTAVIVGRPENAEGFLNCVRAKGLECPRDIELVVIGDDRVFGYMKPSLSALRWQYVKMGEAAARLVLDIVQGREAAPRQVVVPWAYVERDSCRLGEEYANGSSIREEATTEGR